jgi:hypothetical protein
MTTRPRLIALSMACAAVFWASGCQNQPPRSDAPAEAAASDQQPLDLREPPEQGGTVQTTDAQSGSIDAQSRKTEAYSREIAPHIKPTSSSRLAAHAAAQPSAVEWMDPSQFRLGASEPAQANTGGATVAKVMPVIQTSPADGNASAPAAPTNAETSIAMASSGAGPVQVRAAAPAPVTSDALAEKLSRRVKDYPRDVSAHLEYQLLQFLLDEPTPQLAVLSTLPSEDRELVTAVLDGLTNLRNALRADNNMLLSRKIKPILDLSERLRGQADLTIPTISLCTRVNGYGSYDPIEPARFSAGTEHPAIVYCEVANFASNLNDKQLWETRLNWDMTLYTEQGMSVWSDKTESINDAARNRRHDFFVRKMITLPGTLTIGRYLLKVSIVDTQSNRVAEATAPIVIAAQ